MLKGLIAVESLQFSVWYFENFFWEPWFYWATFGLILFLLMSFFRLTSNVFSFLLSLVGLSLISLFATTVLVMFCYSLLGPFLYSVGFHSGRETFEVTVEQVEVEEFSFDSSGTTGRVKLAGKEEPVEVMGSVHSTDTDGRLYCLDGGRCLVSFRAEESNVAQRLWERSFGGENREVKVVS